VEIFGDLGRNRDQRIAAILLVTLHRDALDAIDAAAFEILRQREDELDHMAGRQ
jgi:hypothetical protein